MSRTVTGRSRLQSHRLLYLAFLDCHAKWSTTIGVEEEERRATALIAETVLSSEHAPRIGGVVTLEGVLSVGQTKIGGFFGIGGEDDGGVTISGAKIVKSFEVGSSIVHEVDKLVAPEVVWGYLDQTKLPGTTFLRGLFSSTGLAGR